MCPAGRIAKPDEVTKLTGNWYGNRVGRAKKPKPKQILADSYVIYSKDEITEFCKTLVPGYSPWKNVPAGCAFDPELAQKAVMFFHTQLSHVKGRDARKPFVLEPWQVAIVGNLFGWLRDDDTRRYRTSFIYVPRKNGKTALVAGIIVYMLACDGEQGAEIYGAASKYDQATMLFQHVRGMIIQNKKNLGSRFHVYNGTKKAVTDEESLSYYHVICSKAEGLHGQNTHFAVIDELHTLPDNRLTSAIETSTGARTQPLIIYITTADYDREGSICNEKHSYACSVRDGSIEDSDMLPVIYEADKGDDWTDEKTWEKANPNIGVSVSREFLAKQIQKAQDVPAFENECKRLHLNIRTQQDRRWITLSDWDNCETELVTEDYLTGRPCFGALDLSTKVDLTCWLLLFPPDNPLDPFIVLPRFFCPEASARRRSRLDKVPYESWIKEGLMIGTPGDVVDYSYVEKQVLQDCRDYDLMQAGFDPWNATQVAIDLQNEGVNMAEFRQGYVSMSEPSKELDRLVIQGRINHMENKVLRWMIGHVAKDTDPADNWKPSKKHSTDRIDGVVCLIMALGLWIINRNDLQNDGIIKWI